MATTQITPTHDDNETEAPLLRRGWRKCTFEEKVEMLELLRNWCFPAPDYEAFDPHALLEERSAGFDGETGEEITDMSEDQIDQELDALNRHAHKVEDG